MASETTDKGRGAGGRYCIYLLSIKNIEVTQRVVHICYFIGLVVSTAAILTLKGIPQSGYDSQILRQPRK